ncbi:MAG: nucleotidyl transferase AbiEii/AbiGii toxin family protein [Rickettsiaceae bacterium]|nr:nucleotidyl transferase AbiEii/AbiGii toxin family protein [Rickettsiaceae bacterium]
MSRNFRISKAELAKVAASSKLDIMQIEKDYVLSWILSGIYSNSLIASCWLFKGGTCLRKCYYTNYRFSEDLDFTIINSKPSLKDTKIIIDQLAAYLMDNTGIIIDKSRSILEEATNLSRQSILQGRIFYQGPVSPASPKQWPKIKLDITSDEVIINEPTYMGIMHNYSDEYLLKDSKILTYNFYDLFAEKIRALLERARPRDLYDVVEIFQRTKDLNKDLLKSTLKIKCEFKYITSLDLTAQKIDACKAGWQDQLSHQINNLSPFHNYLEKWYKIKDDL